MSERMPERMIAIDLSDGVEQTIPPETWSGIDPARVVRHLREDAARYLGLETAEEVPNLGLRALIKYASLAPPSKELEERLARLAPKALERFPKPTTEPEYFS